MVDRLSKKILPENEGGNTLFKKESIDFNYLATVIFLNHTALSLVTMNRITIQKQTVFFTLVVLSLSVASFSVYTALSPQNVYGQIDVKKSAGEVSTHVDQALQSYAKAIGAQYIESEHTPVEVNQTLIEKIKGVGEGALVDQKEYQVARDHLKTAQAMFVALIPEIKDTHSEDVIEVQSGLLMLQNLFDYRGAYNIVEDVGYGVVVAHLDNIAK